MQPRIKSLFVAVMVLGAVTAAQAYSLIGPPGANSWQTTALGYGLDGDIGVPVNRDEEYRWNSPTITYAFDQSFLNYFGKQGMDAVDSAVAVFNNLPRVSNFSADLSEFPMDNKKVNYTAKAMGIMDLKSMTLPILLEVMGLAAPERWVYCLYAHPTGTTNGNAFSGYIVIMRNFDPISGKPTNRVNNAFYGYVIQEGLTPGNYADAVEQPIDPLTVTPYSSIAGGLDFPLGAGEIYTGLTRDDAGGWRHLYRYGNVNMENLPSTVTVTNNSTNFLTNTVISSILSNSPWNPYLGATNSYTNYLQTNTYILTNPPWWIFSGQTNGLATNSTVTNATGTNVTGTNATLITTALRPGIEKITFLKTMYDSYIGQAYTPITNVYTDIIISNSMPVMQTVQRVTTAPDIIFTAYDLGLSANNRPWLISRNTTFLNNDAINGQTTAAGPGELTPPIVISYTDILPAFFNDDSTGTPMTQETATKSKVWGSFGPSMDIPIITYPNWVSLQELENLILGNHSAP